VSRGFCRFGWSLVVAKRSWILDCYLRVLFLAFRGFALRGFERDFVVLISRNKADASATVEQPFNANIIGINEAFSDRDKLEMNSSRCFFFSFARCQWFIASSAFQLGNLPITFNVRFPVVLFICGN